MLVDLIQFKKDEPSYRFVYLFCLFLALALVTALVFVTGGTKFVYVHIMYLPIILGAALYGRIGGIIIGVMAGLCVGPLMPLDSYGGLKQPLEGWLLRTLSFSMLGLFAGYLFESLRSLVTRTNQMADAVTLSYKNALKAFADAIEMRDEATAGHSERVAHNAFMVGHALRLSRIELNALYFGALLHDVGKIGVPDAILLKPDKLTKKEVAAAATHAEQGANLILGISPHMTRIADAVRSHHERWDGKGYPNGLKQEEIPVLGRIIKIADEFEAMTSARPYKQALPPGNVIGMMKMGPEFAGHFDPDIFMVFEDLYRNDRILIAGDPIPKGVFEPKSLDIYRSFIIKISEDLVAKNE